MRDDLIKIADDLDSFVHDIREEGDNDATALWLEHRVKSLRRLAAAQEQKPFGFIGADGRFLARPSMSKDEFLGLFPKTEMGAPLIEVYTAPQKPQPAPGWDDADEDAAARAICAVENDMTEHKFEDIAPDTYRKYARAAMKVLRNPPSGAGVEIKQLEWDGHSARCVFGVYRVGRIGAEWTVSFGANYYSNFSDRLTGTAADFDAALVEAKAAAQADYEARIRAALSNPAAADSNASAEARLRIIDECSDALGFQHEYLRTLLSKPQWPPPAPNASDCAPSDGAIYAAISKRETPPEEQASIDAAIDDALSRARDCAKQATDRWLNEPAVCEALHRRPSDRLADVTVEDIAPIICEALFGIYIATETAVSSISGQSRIAARVLLVAFTVGRR